MAGIRCRPRTGLMNPNKTTKPEFFCEQVWDHFIPIQQKKCLKMNLDCLFFLLLLLFLPKTKSKFKINSWLGRSKGLSMLPAELHDNTKHFFFSWSYFLQGIQKFWSFPGCFQALQQTQGSPSSLAEPGCGTEPLEQCWGSSQAAGIGFLGMLSGIWTLLGWTQRSGFPQLSPFPSVRFPLTLGWNRGCTNQLLWGRMESKIIDILISQAKWFNALFFKEHWDL